MVIVIWRFCWMRSEVVVEVLEMVEVLVVEDVLVVEEVSKRNGGR